MTQIPAWVNLENIMLRVRSHSPEGQIQCNNLEERFRLVRIKDTKHTVFRVRRGHFTVTVSM